MYYKYIFLCLHLYMYIRNTYSYSNLLFIIYCNNLFFFYSCIIILIVNVCMSLLMFIKIYRLMLFKSETILKIYANI